MAVRGLNSMNAQFAKRLGRPAPSGGSSPSWMISDQQRAAIQNAANQVAAQLRRPETINALKQMAIKFGSSYGRK